jgi:hypothetical protein
MDELASIDAARVGSGPQAVTLWILRKISFIDGVHDPELLDRSAVDVAFENLVQRRSRGLKTKLHLFENELGLTFPRPLHLSSDRTAEIWIR